MYRERVYFNNVNPLAAVARTAPREMSWLIRIKDFLSSNKLIYVPMKCLPV